MARSERPDITLSLEFITPEVAEQRLLLNTANRPIRPTVVARYAADMIEGKWNFDGAPYRHNGDGSVLDGQHRYTAIAQSQVGQWGVVIRGVETESQLVMDSGERRKFRDWLHGRGYCDVGSLAALTSSMAKWDAGNRFTCDPGIFGKVTTHSALREYFESHEAELLRSLTAGKGLYKEIRVPRTLGATLFAVFHRISAEDCEVFWHYLRTGDNLSQSSPIHQLRKRFIADNLANSAKTPTRVKAALTIKAWNLWIRGDEAKLLIWRQGGAGAEEFPEPLHPIE